MMLLESQFKVDSQKAEAALMSLQKDAAGKIAFLEQKLQEETKNGQKLVDAKQSEIQALEVQFSLTRKSLENAFTQKKDEIELQHKDLQAKLIQMNQLIEKEREDHRQELLKRDDLILSLKQEMSRETDLARAERDRFAG